MGPKREGWKSVRARSGKMANENKVIRKGDITKKVLLRRVL